MRTEVRGVFGGERGITGSQKWQMADGKEINRERGRTKLLRQLSVRKTFMASAERIEACHFAPCHRPMQCPGHTRQALASD